MRCKSVDSFSQHEDLLRAESVQALDFPMMVLHKGGIVPRKGIEIKSF